MTCDNEKTKRMWIMNHEFVESVELGFEGSNSINCTKNVTAPSPFCTPSFILCISHVSLSTWTQIGWYWCLYIYMVD